MRGKCAGHILLGIHTRWTKLRFMDTSCDDWRGLAMTGSTGIRILSVVVCKGLYSAGYGGDRRTPDRTVSAPRSTTITLVPQGRSQVRLRSPR